MNYKRPLVLDIITWIHSLFLFACVYPFLASLGSCKGAVFWRMTVSGLVLLVPVVLSWLIMQKQINLLQYVLVSVPVIALTAFLSLITGGKLCAVLGLGFSLLVFGLRMHSKITYGNKKQEFSDVHHGLHFDLQEREMPGFLNCPQPYHWVWFTLLYVSGMILHFTTFLYIMFALLFVDIFLCLGYHYISSLYEYARKNQHVANFPLKTMQKIHRMTGIIGGLLLILFLLPAVLYGREFQPDLTTDKPLLSFDEVMEETQQYSAPEEVADTQIVDFRNFQEKDSPKWIYYLAKMIGYVCSAIFIIALAIRMIRAVRKLGKDFSVEEEDEVVFLEPDHTDSVKGIFRSRGRESFLSASQQVRKRYKKTIKKASKEKPSQTATPAELEKNAGLAEDASMQVLHGLYEKARYSEAGCTDEDLKLF